MTSCPLCDSPKAIELGSLGHLRHFRCRDCGANYSLGAEIKTTFSHRKKVTRMSAEDRYVWGLGDSNTRITTVNL